MQYVNGLLSYNVGSQCLVSTLNAVVGKIFSFCLQSDMVTKLGQSVA